MRFARFALLPFFAIALLAVPAAAQNLALTQGGGGDDGEDQKAVKPFPLHIYIDLSQAVGSGTLYGFQKDPANATPSNDVSPFQAFNAFTGTTLFVQGSASWNGINAATSFWATWEQTLSDLPNGRNIYYGDPLTNISYTIPIPALSMALRPSVAYLAPLSQASRWRGRLGTFQAGLGGGWRKWGFSVGGGVNLRYTLQVPQLGGDPSAINTFTDIDDTSKQPVNAALSTLATDNDATALLGNTQGLGSLVSMSAGYGFDKFSFSAALLFISRVNNPIGADEYTDPLARAGMSVEQYLNSTFTFFSLRGNYQALSWLTLYAQYQVIQSLTTWNPYGGRGYEPMDYDEWKGSERTSYRVVSPLAFDVVNGPSNTMTLNAGFAVTF